MLASKISRACWSMWLISRFEDYLRAVLRFILKNAELVAVLHHSTRNACHDGPLIHTAYRHTSQDINGHLLIVGQISNFFGKMWQVFGCPLVKIFAHFA